MHEDKTLGDACGPGSTLQPSVSDPIPIACPETAAPGVDEREEFEAWARRDSYHLKRSDAAPERYHAWLTNALWNGWQARAALAAPTSAHGATFPDAHALASLWNRAESAWNAQTGAYPEPWEHFAELLRAAIIKPQTTKEQP